MAKNDSISSDLPEDGAAAPASNGTEGTQLVPKQKKLETGETARERQLVQESALIGLNAPDPNDIRFMHSVLCQVGLPRSKVEGREFKRQSGAAWIIIQAGSLDEGDGQPVEQPIPYGALPRLAMAWISTYAVKHKTREIPIGDSAADFLRQLGMEKTGKRYDTLRTQMHAMAACRMQFGFKGRTFNGQPVEQFDAWHANASTPQKSIWPGIMVLSENYHQSLIRSAVPLDNRALMLLKGTALGLDVYVWLSQRLHRLDEAGVLSWYVLKEQFGQEYTGVNALKDFKREFTRVLHIVQQAYPQAQVSVVRGGVMIKPSPPPIPYKA